MAASDPVVLFERATARATTVMTGVTIEQLDGPTPCADWDVQQLIDHMVGGTDYLLAALAGEAPLALAGRSVEDYDPGARTAVQRPSCSWQSGPVVHVATRLRMAGRARRWPGRSWMR